MRSAELPEQPSPQAEAFAQSSTEQSHLPGRPGRPLRGAFENSTLPIAHVAFDSNWLKFNSAFCELLGYAEPELLRLNLEKISHADDFHDQRYAAARLKAGEANSDRVPMRLIHKDGHLVPTLLTLSVTRDDTDHPLYCTLQFDLIADRQESDSAAIDNETSFRELADLAPVLIWVADASQSCDYFNRGWLDFTGRTLEQERGSGWTAGLFPEDREQVILAYRHAFATREPFEIEYRLRRHDGAYRWLLAAGVPRYSSHGQFAGYIGTCVDITERKRSQLELEQLLAASDEAHVELAAKTQRLHRLAESDPLTGLLNRRGFHEQFELEWRRATRHNRPLACVMLDVDFFKKVNDTHGHAAGDAILKQIADSLLSQCRPNDLVCRYGGEEFCIMVPETTEAGAVTLAERLRLALAKMCFETGGKLHAVTSSFGVAERQGDVRDFEELIRRADHALRIAKLSGRNRVVRFTCGEAASEQLAADSPLRLLSELTAADLMIPTPCVACDATVEEAVEALLGDDAESAPVVDSQGLLVGLVAQRDLMAIDVSRNSWSSPVRELMRTNVVCYDESTPGDQIYQFLCRVSIHQVVVMNNNRPTGVISPTSLLAFFRDRVVAEPEFWSPHN